jgi:hypothetical protein
MCRPFKPNTEEWTAQCLQPLYHRRFKPINRDHSIPGKSDRGISGKGDHRDVKFSHRYPLEKHHHIFRSLQFGLKNVSIKGKIATSS